MGIEREQRLQSKSEQRRLQAPQRYALEYVDEKSFVKALTLLQNLASAGPLEYDTLGDGEQEPWTTVLPEWSYRQVAPLLRDRKVRYKRLEVAPMSELSAHEQARLRGLLQDRR